MKRTLSLWVTGVALAGLFSAPLNTYAQDAEDGGWGSTPSASERYSSSGSAWGTSGETLGGTTRDAGPTLPGAPTQVPVDGGLALLAAAGSAYAAGRLRKRRRDQSHEGDGAAHP